MNLDSLKMYCLVVENESISKAARMFFVSQPAVTRQMKALEEYYGVLLFERSGGKLFVTKAGQLLYPYFKAIIQDHGRAQDALSHLMGEYQAHISVGATLTIGEYLLPKLLGRFKRKNPDLQLAIQIENTQNILENLANHTIDIALVEGSVNDPSFIVEKFAEDELILICASHHKWAKQNEINPEQLIGESMIWREEGSGTRTLVEAALRERGLLDKTNAYIEIASTQAIKASVEAGLGVTFLSRMTVLRELSLGVVQEVKIKGISLNRDLWLVLAPQKFRRLGIDKMLHFFQEGVKNEKE